MREHALEFCRIGPRHQEGLARFFQELMELGDHRWFHPHPFTAAQAECLAAYQGQDLYYVATRGEVVAYGMLRGWDEGYQVPSLGIAVHPAWRGRGLAHAFMLFLHAAARERGAHGSGSKCTRRTVPPGNFTRAWVTNSRPATTGSSSACVRWGHPGQHDLCFKVGRWRRVFEDPGGVP